MGPLLEREAAAPPGSTAPTVCSLRLWANVRRSPSSSTRSSRLLRPIRTASSTAALPLATLQHECVAPAACPLAVDFGDRVFQRGVYVGLAIGADAVEGRSVAGVEDSVDPEACEAWIELPLQVAHRDARQVERHDKAVPVPHVRLDR